jgi:hypothetical protein
VVRLATVPERVLRFPESVLTVVVRAARAPDTVVRLLFVVLIDPERVEKLEATVPERVLTVLVRALSDPEIVLTVLVRDTIEPESVLKFDDTVPERVLRFPERVTILLLIPAIVPERAYWAAPAISVVATTQFTVLVRSDPLVESV